MAWIVGRTRSLQWTLTAIALAASGCQTLHVPGDRRPARYDPQPYAQVLRGVATEAGVDYARLRTEFATDLDIYLDGVARFGPTADPSAFPARADRVAYLLNVHNAIVLQSWLRRGAGAGGGAVTATEGLILGRPWRVDGQRVTLRELQMTLRREAANGLPLLPAGIYTGAKMSPCLQPIPFAGTTLDAQLDTAMRRWLCSGQGLAVDQDRLVTASPQLWEYRTAWKPIGGLPGLFERYLDDDDPRRLVAIRAAVAGRLAFPDAGWRLHGTGRH